MIIRKELGSFALYMDKNTEIPEKRVWVAVSGGVKDAYYALKNAMKRKPDA